MPGGHFLCNETKEAKFTSVPLRRHKVRYAPAPWAGAIRPLPCVGSSGKSHACFGCSVVNALPTPPLRYQLFPGVGYFRFKGKKNGCFYFPAWYTRKIASSRPSTPARGQSSFRSGPLCGDHPLHFLAPASPKKVPLASPARLVNALTTAPLR